MDQAAARKIAGESEPVPALGTQRGRRFVDWAVFLSVSKVRDQAHLGLCSPTMVWSVADRSLSGSTRSPESPRDDQLFSSQPTTQAIHNRALSSCGVVENGAPTPFTTASTAMTANRKEINS